MLFMLGSPWTCQMEPSIKSQLSGSHLALQSCSVNLPHPWAAFLRRILSFNDTPRNRNFLEQNPAHIGNIDLWPGQKITSNTAIHFCLKRMSTGVRARRFGIRPEFFFCSDPQDFSGYSVQKPNSCYLNKQKKITYYFIQSSLSYLQGIK